MNNLDKKILLVASEFPPGPGGIGNHAYSLAKHLEKKGYIVNVVVDSNYADDNEITHFDKQLPEGISIIRVKRNGWRTYYNRIRYVAIQLKNNKFEVVIFSGKFSLWLAGLFQSPKKNVPFLAVLHGTEVQIKKSRINRLLTNWGIGRCDFLLPVSKFTWSLLNEDLRNKRYKIISNGIDLSEFEILDQRAISSDFTLNGMPRLLTVGNVTPRKGQHRVIKALPEILNVYPNTHYHIVGLPTYKDEFLKLATALKVDHAITFHGRLATREELAKAYKQADCFLILSENQADGDVEGFGIVILEANFFGLPAIGAKGCGISDAISDKKNGFLVDGDDPKEITQRLREVLEYSSEFSKDSIDWALRHNWDTIVDQYINVISLCKEI